MTGTGFRNAVFAIALTECAVLAIQAAMLLHVFRLTGGSVPWVGAMVLATLATSAFAPLLGARIATIVKSNLRVVACCYAGCGVVLLSIAPLDHVWTLFWLHALASAAFWIGSPSRQAVIRELAAAGTLMRANSIDATFRGAAQISGAAIGAAVYAYSQSLIVTALTAAAATLSSSAVLWAVAQSRRREGLPPAPGRREAAAAGPRLAAGGTTHSPSLDGLLSFVVAMTVVSGFAVGLLDPLLRPFIEENALGGDASYAIWLAAFGAGCLVGPWIGNWAYRRIGAALTVFAAFFSEALVFAAWSQSGSVVLSTVLFVAWGANNYAFLPCQANLVHTRVDPARQPAVFALLDNASFLPQLLVAASIVAVLGDLSPTRLLQAGGLFYCGSFVLVLGFYALSRRIGRTRHAGAGTVRQR